MYKYQLILDRVIKENAVNPMPIEKVSKKFGEEKYRAKLQKAFNDLKQADTMLIKENVEEKIKNQIKLY